MPILLFSVVLSYESLFFATREESLLQDIQPDEFQVKLQDPKFVEEAQLIDVREPDEVYVILLYINSGFFSLFDITF